MKKTRFFRTLELVESALKAGGIPGIAVGVWGAALPEGPEVLVRGEARRLPVSEPLTRAHRFDLASLTKVMATTPLVAALVERGWLEPSTPIGAWMPDTRHARLTVEQLLSHTAGLAAWAPLWSLLVERFAGRPLWKVSRELRRLEAREWLERVEPESRPGQKALYSDLGFLVLGYAIEELLGERLDRLVRRHVWLPMGLGGLEYRVVRGPAEEGRDRRCVATEDSRWRGGVLQGQVHDDNAWALGGVAPHAGVFGTVDDVLGFARALLEGHFSPAVTRWMWTRVTEPAGCGRTPGWDTPSARGSSAGERLGSRPGVVGHLGFTGTSLWIDPARKLAVALLTNRVHPSREGAGVEAIKRLRPALHDAVMEDLGF